MNKFLRGDRVKLRGHIMYTVLVPRNSGGSVGVRSDELATRKVGSSLSLGLAITRTLKGRMFRFGGRWYNQEELQLYDPNKEES